MTITRDDEVSELVEVYEYRPYKIVVLPMAAREIVNACSRGVSEGEFIWPTPWSPRPRLHFQCSRGEVTLCVEEECGHVELDILAEAAEHEDWAFEIKGNRLVRLEVYREGFYIKLKPLGVKPPTLEINGVHMHRIEGTDPWRDSMTKVRRLRVRRGHRVLDVCTGLGYTAILEAIRGATVVTVEVSEEVLYMAERNPWSWIMEKLPVTVVRADATTVIHKLPDNYFDRIMHDPPRYSLAGELYSLEFYSELYRVLRRQGILFHYTGQPGRHTGKRIVEGIMKRLREAGFDKVLFDEEAQGVIALKF